jgi:hypothetical protein
LDSASSAKKENTKESSVLGAERVSIRSAFFFVQVKENA